VLLAAIACSIGCSSAPPPQSASAPPRGAPAAAAAPATPVTAPDAEPERIVVGGADSVGAVAGSPGAQFLYVFKQTDPASDRFTFQDRDLSFYFRPSPTVLHFQVENRQDKPVYIDWDKSAFIDGYGNSKRIANADTRWAQRFTAIAPTQIAGLQRHGDYVFPIDLLVDPGSSDDQLHRPLFPEDRSAPQYVDREFGVTLTFRFQDHTQPYAFRFKVRSVLPR
jgi:hypothetical protein